MRNALEQICVAAQVGLDFFGVGERTVASTAWSAQSTWTDQALVTGARARMAAARIRKKPSAGGTTLRSSYSSYYRQMMPPPLLKVAGLQCNNPK